MKKKIARRGLPKKAATRPARLINPPESAGIVAIAQDHGLSKTALLEQALNDAQFWPHLEQARLKSKARRDKFRILIKPDIDFFHSDLPTYTDPELVEHLIALLHSAGYSSVTVGEGHNDWGNWLENRGPLVVSELAGYRFQTLGGTRYEIVPLISDAHQTSEGQIAISEHWLTASYRINFAKNKTDIESGFALCLRNLLGVTASDKWRADAGPALAEIACTVLQQAPPNFSLIDAVVSGHGGAGRNALKRLTTDTIVASPSTLLADWVGALKMGVDPYSSPINATALRTIGLPEPYHINGSLKQYAGWYPVHPLAQDSTKKRNQWSSVRAMLDPWLQVTDQQQFPFKSTFDERANKLLSLLPKLLDEHFLVFAATVSANYGTAAVHSALRAVDTVYRKHRLPRPVALLEMDPNVFHGSDFEAVASYIEPLERLLQDIPPDHNGLRWRYLDGSVLFDFSKVISVAYDAFISRVQISRAIQYMTDYIGGTVKTREIDSNGRVIQQFERNLYLPQPNWLAFFGGKMIDVEKLELIRYEEDSQKILWKTVRSSNDSADFDDGSVTFQRDKSGATVVRVMARQKFSLPLALQAAHLELFPALKNYLITDSYTRFFSKTMDNLLSEFEGRQYRIGSDSSEADSANGAGWDLKGVVDLLTSKVKQSLAGSQQRSNEASTNAEVDSYGFSHFKARTSGSTGTATVGFLQSPVSIAKNAAHELPAFINGLVDAIRKDLRSPNYDGRNE